MNKLQVIISAQNKILEFAKKYNDEKRLWEFNQSNFYMVRFFENCIRYEYNKLNFGQKKVLAIFLMEYRKRELQKYSTACVNAKQPTNLEQIQSVNTALNLIKKIKKDKNIFVVK